MVESMVRPYLNLRTYDLEREFDGAQGVIRALAGELGRRRCYEALRFDVDAETLRRLLGRRAIDPWQQQLVTFDEAHP
ncbi:hypothetical protein [Methylobacterium gnaphalii]|uniref:Uncharacterized protein n=1 Tax=Methylobacterium gnaphalii TaxID=1010610 RepID=A0A512JG16_9HYPH|nr:hypothetical protein [Methylobacterium gnaphalii]GEP08894.1 hypothetical protein MGN01_07390 [Methylobacterium gnaphalii]GLS47659.1 hypothetical protein GCM10007885_05030 [Methylobacterium gnaphalii]